VRPIDSCITQLKAQGPPRTCNESNEVKDSGIGSRVSGFGFRAYRIRVGSWPVRGRAKHGLMDSGMGSRVSGFGLRNVQRFRGGLVFKVHRLLYHPTLGLRVIKKKKKFQGLHDEGWELAGAEQYEARA